MLAGLFGVSAILWFALWVLLTIAGEDGPAEPMRPGDRWIATALVMAAILPVPLLSSAALFIAGLWLFRSSAWASRTRRIACVTLALTLPLLWGPLVLKLWGSELLVLDARFAAAMIGGQSVGNIFTAPGGQTSFAVAQGCSSMANISLASVLVVALVQKFHLPYHPSLIGWTLAATAAVILINGIRMGMIALHPDQFVYLHHGPGMVMFGWAALLASAVIIGWGISRQRGFAIL